MRGHVLLVDDEPALLRVFTRVLEEAGYEVKACDSALRAAELIADGGLDAVVSDIVMPKLDGIGLLRLIRSHDPDLPVILMTGAPTTASAIGALEYGAFQYLTKPIDGERLERSVARAVNAGRIARTKRIGLELLGSDNMLVGDRAGLEAAFQRALASLSTVYQPILRASDRTVVGYEALLRSDEALLPNPEALMLAAERLEQVDLVGRTVRERTITPPQGQMLFMNLHPQELMQTNLHKESAIADLADCVVLEVTERAALDRVPGLLNAVSGLREAGIRIAVDDLGAGYAGLNSFALLEPDFVKIDMTLIRNVDANGVKQKLVGTMTSLCKDLGIVTVAEGIETEAERDAVVELGVDLVQGFRFAQPGRAFPAASW